MTRARDFADLAGAASSGNISGRNVITNGAVQVAQRATSVTGIGGADGYFTADRWKVFQASLAGRVTQSQASVTDLAGFPNSLKHEVTTADTSISAGEAFQLSQVFEGQDLQSFKKGYSDAEQFTFSFYVKGTAKTYCVEMYDGDNTRHVAKTFSVTSSWNRVELTYPADTTGKFDDDNALSLYIIIWLHAGSNFTSGTLPATWASVTNANRAVGAESLFSATSNTFEITGAQLEVGEKATEFEHRSYADEYLRCIRYAYVPGKYGAGGTGSGFLSEIVFPVQMRATPACTNVFSAGYDNTNAFGNSPEANEFSISNILSGNGVSWSSAPTSIAQTEQTVDRSFVYPNGGSTPGESTDQNIYVFKFGTGAYIIFDAEL